MIATNSSCWQKKNNLNNRRPSRMNWQVWVVILDWFLLLLTIKFSNPWISDTEKNENLQQHHHFVSSLSDFAYDISTKSQISNLHVDKCDVLVHIKNNINAFSINYNRLHWACLLLNCWIFQFSMNFFYKLMDGNVKCHRWMLTNVLDEIERRRKKQANKNNDDGDNTNDNNTMNTILSVERHHRNDSYLYIHIVESLSENHNFSQYFRNVKQWEKALRINCDLIMCYFVDMLSVRQQTFQLWWKSNYIYECSLFW